jgi:hypothetical protein
LWQRFRGACDAFFDRYKRRDQIELEAKQADREALVSELESLTPAALSEAGELKAPEVAVDLRRRPSCRLKTRRSSSAYGRFGTAGTSRRQLCGRAPILSAPASWTRSSASLPGHPMRSAALNSTSRPIDRRW